MCDIDKNQIYTAEIEGFTSEGMGVSRIDGRAVFVHGAIPGETWRFKITKVTKTVVYARGLECLKASESRVEPACPFFSLCGGCDLMHMSYEAELGMKRDRVNDALRRIGGLTLEISGIVPCEATGHYRNKAVYNISGENGVPVFGFYRSGSHDVVSIDRCMLQTETSDNAAAAVCEWMKKRSIKAYDEKSGSGAVRHVFVRSARSGSAVCCVVSAEGFGKHTSSLVAALNGACPGLTGIVLNINKKAGNAIFAGDFYTLWGDPDIGDTLCGFEFKLSPRAFYQINPPQAEKLYARAVALALPCPGGTVLDLYCGAGTISLCLARRAEKVIGAEIVPEAVANAAENAANNGIKNTEFICADAAEAAKELSRRGVTPAAVVVDPPRKGMSEDAVFAVASMCPERVVYVSCDPATLARDLKRFAALGYRAISAEAVDMFPRTVHVETVVMMSRTEVHG
ncbi:MAG: 23S rRNA (uracil(1939)-C(5))-methyltransferase RlmD [Clostridia bacterium]|nr:23S rRNA (uracil(1939)-C(5))-methyltransferase RlmD [Clostridia bacterium]NCC68692.1 23S rRNA (uracil(1939)-C(5))-methyltransferase RlmD [Clostridia bacterium]